MLSRRGLGEGGDVFAAATTRDGLAILIAPGRRVGSPTLLVLDAEGRARRVRRRRIAAGRAKKQIGGRFRVWHRSPGLAIDVERGRAYVVTAGKRLAEGRPAQSDTSAGLSVLDTRNWTSRRLLNEARWFHATADLILARTTLRRRTGTVLSGFTHEGAARFQAQLDTVSFGVQSMGPYARTSTSQTRTDRTPSQSSTPAPASRWAGPSRRVGCCS